MAFPELAQVCWGHRSGRPRRGAPSSAAEAIAALDRAIMIRIAPVGKVSGEDEIDPSICHDSVHFLSGDPRDRLQARSGV